MKINAMLNGERHMNQRHLPTRNAWFLLNGLNALNGGVKR